jgi:hypothetical protein
MLNNFLKARAGEGLGVIKFVADLGKFGKDTVLQKGHFQIRDCQLQCRQALKLAFSRHLSDD